MKEAQASKSWSKQEIEILKESWGSQDIYQIAKKLKRSPSAVESKANKLKLGPARLSSGMITANELANILGINIYTIINTWIQKYNLNCSYKILKKSKRYCFIDIDDFWQWAYKNQDKFDSKKMELNILGKEPSWMAEKRQKDMHNQNKNIPKTVKPWTKKEEAALIKLYHNNFSFREIANWLGRSRTSVEQKFYRLKK